MPRTWQQMLSAIRDDHGSGASVLLGRAIEAGRLFLIATRSRPPGRLAPLLAQFTKLLTTSQPSMAPFLTFANALWRCTEGPRELTWSGLHAAMVEYAEGVDRGLVATVRHGANLVKSGSLVLTYSHSTAVRMALLRALGAGRRFEVVCSESRPIGEGVALARCLAFAGIPVHLTTDAALAAWIDRSDLLLVGADAVLGTGVVNKVGTEMLLRAARRARVPAYVVADSSKWLPPALARFWRPRDESPAEVTSLRHSNLQVHNRYFDRSPLRPLTGLVWERGIATPSEVRRRTAEIAISKSLMAVLETWEEKRRP